MKIILADSRMAGSLDWELPAHISELVESLPRDKQEFAINLIKEDLLLYLTLSLEAFRKDMAEPKGMPRFDYIEEKHMEIMRYLGFTKPT